jgi:ssDNA-binding Zn-finger/Zn-ribbon topoisomerase 1
MRHWLWKKKLYDDKCPNCGAKLIEHGYAGTNLRYSCSNKECDFGRKGE